jgi:hypothetical protein
MSKNKLSIKIFFIIFFLLSFGTSVFSKIMILSDCKNSKDSFIKNEYILDLESSLMKRNYVFDNKTYKKYRKTDLSVKKENSIERFIYRDKNFILTEKIGYPQFFTQLVFVENSPIIQIKTVINNESGISNMSTCKKVELFDKES